MKKIKFIFILLVIVLIVIFFIELNLAIKSKMTEQKLSNEPLNNYPVVIDRASLLDAYLNNKAKIILQNNLEIGTSLNFSNVFYTNQKILDKLNIKDTDSDQQKANRIYQFVKKLDARSKFYRNGVIDPSVIYSTNGFGDCGTLADLICVFGEIYNIKCKGWHLSGHAVVELFYDDNWHLYDPTGIGTITNNNQIMDLNYAILLAKNNQLSVYNKEYAATQNHLLLYYQYHNKDFLLEEQILQNFLPSEKKYFFNNSFLVKNLSTNPNLQYDDVLSGFIREIPLYKFNPVDSLVIDDFFPIIGVFIIFDRDPNLKIKDLPVLDFLDNNQKITDQTFSYRIDNKHYIIDLSKKIEQVMDEPVYLINLHNLGRLLEKVEKVEILTVHLYSKKYSDFSQSNLNNLKKENVNVSIFTKN